MLTLIEMAQTIFCVRKLSIVSLLLASVLSGSCAEYGKSQAYVRLSEVFSYHDEESGHAEVIDLKRHVLVAGDKKILADPSGAESEFSGPIDICTNQEFYCIETGLILVIPRGGIISSWSMNGISCTAKAVGEVGDKIFDITCAVNGRKESTHFLYNPARGVLSYQRLCVGCIAPMMKLVGIRGLFSQ